GGEGDERFGIDELVGTEDGVQYRPLPPRQALRLQDETVRGDSRGEGAVVAERGQTSDRGDERSGHLRVVVDRSTFADLPRAHQLTHLTQSRQIAVCALEEV